MKTIRVRITLEEEMLGMSSSNPEIQSEFIASKAPDAKSTEEEIAAIGVDAYVEKSMTVFPRVNGSPFMWDYQIKGMFKDTCGMLYRVPETVSSKLKAYKKVIDGLIFPSPRRIILYLPPGEIVGNCQRPLRCQTAQGERVALANSETVPAGTWLQFDVLLLNEAHEKLIDEWLDYGKLRGLGQWRNSGKGRYTWKKCD
jgi:hypothetical protein